VNASIRNTIYNNVEFVLKTRHMCDDVKLVLHFSHHKT
jgi:hypothetical protein